MDNDALVEYLRVQSAADRELRRVLKEAAIDAARRINAASDGVGGQVRAAQLALVLAHIRQSQVELWRDEILPIIIKYFPRVLKVADEAAERLDDTLNAYVGERYARALVESLQAASGAGIMSDRARRAHDLSLRVYRNADLAAGRIERTIRAGVVQGNSAREIARSVRKYIAPDTRGGVSYAAMRLARTELNNTFHEEQIAAAQDRPWVRGVKWNLSKSHPEKDICNEYAETAHKRGWPKGVYPPDQVPLKPHPHCFCYMTYDLKSQKDVIAMAVQAGLAA